MQMIRHIQRKGFHDKTATQGIAIKSIFAFCLAGMAFTGMAVAHDHEDDDDEDDRMERRVLHNCRALSRARFADPQPIATAKLYVEYNYTDEDLGVHGAFDDTGYRILCVYDPSGRPVLKLKPKRQLADLAMAGIFFESREPHVSEFSYEDLKSKFPEGEYEARAISYDGKAIAGAASFTHDVPVAPVVTFPMENEVVSPYNLIVSWEQVTETIAGDPANITGYEVIITKDVDDDPNGYSRPTYDVHVPADRNTLTVPDEFLEPATSYELEILALEVSGNQTISVLFFETE
jgi:hypothetical protein